MDWMTVGIAALFVGLLFLPRLRWVGAELAKKRVKDGAVLLDVRSRMEVASTSVSGAVSVPLGSLAQELPGLGWSKDQDILVFCASGARSAMAVRELKRLGYGKAVNLGSLARARSVAAG